jgi:hypothetical protein
MAPMPGPTPEYSLASVQMVNEGHVEVPRWQGGCDIHTVDPMFLVEGASDDARSERPSGIERATSVVYAHELGDEESEADANRGDESSCRSYQYTTLHTTDSRKQTYLYASPLPT